MMPIVPVLNGLDMVRLRDQVLTAPVFDGVAGDYPKETRCLRLHRQRSAIASVAVRRNSRGGANLSLDQGFC